MEQTQFLISFANQCRPNMFDIWPVAKILLDKLNYKFSKCLH